MEEITISCNFSFMIAGDYLCKINSKFKNNLSTIRHLSFSDFEGKFIEEAKFEVEGDDNFRNLVETIIFNNRENSILYLPFEGMKQDFETNVSKWKSNFLIFCLGGHEETKECYAKPFIDLSDEELKNIFEVDDVFKFIELYEETLGYVEYLDLDMSNLSKIFDELNAVKYDFKDLLDKLYKYEENLKSAKSEVEQKLTRWIDFVNTHNNKISYEYIKFSTTPAGPISKFIAQRSIAFFMEYYWRKNKEIPKGRHLISYFRWNERSQIKQYEDFKDKEDKEVIFK